MSEIKLCPNCGLDYDKCENCEREGCFNCDGWTMTSDDCPLCPECAAAIKEEYNTNTDNGTKICETCSHFAPDEDDEEYGSCRNNRGGVHQSEWCKEWNKHQEKQQDNETN